jgi:hypothetical protein
MQNHSQVFIYIHYSLIARKVKGQGLELRSITHDLMADDLFVAKAHFYLGNYQLAINEAMSVRSIDAVERAKENLVLHAHICLGNIQVMLSEFLASGFFFVFLFFLNAFVKRKKLRFEFGAGCIG